MKSKLAQMAMHILYLHTINVILASFINFKSISYNFSVVVAQVAAYHKNVNLASISLDRNEGIELNFAELHLKHVTDKNSNCSRFPCCVQFSDSSDLLT